MTKNGKILPAADYAGQGIRLTILGDSGPFSITGKSICYLVQVKNSMYLVDCAAPVFQLLGLKRLLDLDGIFVTHPHDDHKRTFTDVALYFKYSGSKRRVRLITTEEIHHEFKRSSSSALESTLSLDSSRIINMPYEDFVEQIPIGPQGSCKPVYRQDENGVGRWFVEDLKGHRVGPKKAKLVFHPQIPFPRMLFRDSKAKLWIEPFSYYDFDDLSFYQEDRRDYFDTQAGLRVRALRAASWHGIAATSLEFTTDNERLVFSSDTVYNPELWKRLASEKHKQKLDTSKAEFERRRVMYGNINDYLEAVWSRRRWENALKTYDDAVVMHDVAEINSVVHTDYPLIAQAPFEHLILTHSPDDFISKIPLSGPGKVYRIIGRQLYEEENENLYPLLADIYIKQGGINFVGFISDRGEFAVYEENGLLRVVRREDLKTNAIMLVDLYQEVAGGFYPRLKAPNEEYLSRGSGVVEKITRKSTGCKGEIIRDMRAELTLRKAKAAQK